MPAFANLAIEIAVERYDQDCVRILCIEIVFVKHLRQSDPSIGTRREVLWSVHVLPSCSFYLSFYFWSTFGFTFVVPLFYFLFTVGLSCSRKVGKPQRSTKNVFGSPV